MLFGAQIHLELSAFVSSIYIIWKQRIVPGLCLSSVSNFTTSRSRKRKLSLEVMGSKEDVHSLFSIPGNQFK